MEYNIIKFFTENLDITSFQQLDKIHEKNNESIELLVNFKTDFITKNDNSIKILKANYRVNATNAPISLNWTGGIIFEGDNITIDNFNSEEFLNKDEISDFFNEMVSKLSFFVGGKLPQISQIMEKNNDKSN